MTILKAAYITFSAFMTALFVWAAASYIDSLFNALYQPWNFWALVLGL